MSRRARACRFTTPYGSREIYHDGKPFITIHRTLNKFDTGSSRPTDVDTVAREIKKLLCGEKKTRSALSGSFLSKLFGKKKTKPRVGDKTIYWFPGPGGGSPMSRRGRGMSGARRRRRRRR